MGCFASALQKYYTRKGGKIVFANGMSLNKLALEMWEGQHFSKIDASVLSKVINGKRIFTKQQLETFCSLLRVPQIEKDFLLFCLQKDYCSREQIDIDEFYISKTEVFTLIKDLLLFASDAQRRHDDQSSDMLLNRIDSIIKKLYNTKHPLFEKKELHRIFMQHSFLKIKKQLHNPHCTIYIAHDENIEKIYTSTPVLKQISPRSYGSTMRVYKTRIPHIGKGERILRIHPILRSIHPGSDLIYPVVANNEFIGMLSLLSSKDKIFTKNDIEITTELLNKF